MNHIRKRIGILGGTFDPIHFGHLRAALELLEQIPLHEIRLIPCRIPVHRAAPLASADARLEMVKLAVENSPLLIDEREMHHEGPSYSVDTLQALRSDYPDASLCMIIGMDAFWNLPSWYQSEKLLELANIIVIPRAGWEISENKSTYNLLKQHILTSLEEISNFRAGKILFHPVTSLNISASAIRKLIQSGRSPQFLLPTQVWEYIQKHALYGCAQHHFNPEVKEIL